MTLLVVGASVAGIRTVQALRLQGYAGAVTVIGEEPHHPYDKPPISKQMLAAEGTGNPVPLLDTEELVELDIDLRLGLRATALDPVARTVSTDSGESFAYTQLVIATGASPRMLPGTDEHTGIFTLRKADDAFAVRRCLSDARHVVVIGAGFIGAEFASAATRYGADVTVVEAQRTPMGTLLGEQVGEHLGGWHAVNGVRLISGVAFERFVGDGGGAVAAVVLADGTTLPADLVVVGVGACPATDWLEGSGLPLRDGVECDERLRVVGWPDIHAAGDVARWPHAFYESVVRIEHWTNANEHAAIVAADLTGAGAPRVQVPYVWSDQYGHRLQIVGFPRAGTALLVRGTSDDPVLALYVDTAGQVVGAVVQDDPRALMKCTKAIAARSDAHELSDALEPSRRT